MVGTVRSVNIFDTRWKELLIVCVGLCLGGKKCPDCDFVYGTKWELNRHMKNKHIQKVVEETWEVNMYTYID